MLIVPLLTPLLPPLLPPLLVPAPAPAPPSAASPSTVASLSVWCDQSAALHALALPLAAGTAGHLQNWLLR